jgi:sugar O-acyltransferase (sialic acid O-acetyltransferase NeuD family)
MKKYVIFGGGAFLSDVFDLIHSVNGTVYKIYLNLPETDRKGEIGLKQRVSYLNYDVGIHESLATFEPEDGCHYVVGCITVQKYRLVEELKREFGIYFSSLVHPKAHIGSNTHIGEGVLISPGTVIAPNACLDDFCAINRGVSIGHDAQIGKYTRIGPSVALAGGAQIGDKCNIGIGAIVLDFVNIGKWSVIGAGSVVTRSLPKEIIAYGVPAKVIRKNENANFDIYMDQKHNPKGT